MIRTLINVLLLLIIITRFSSTLSEGSSSSVVAKRLQERYEDKANECYEHKDHVKLERPVYECNGLLIRGVNMTGKLPFAWSLSESNKKRIAFDFSYLRQDSNWNKNDFPYESGFIMYPQQKTPWGKKPSPAWCAFPLVGDTYARTGKGCGDSHADHTDRETLKTLYNESGHCDKLHISTFEDWKEHFKRVAVSLGSKHYFPGTQCSFDMWYQESASGLFQVVIKANKFLNTTWYKEQTIDILIKSWNEEEERELPIEAFFYVAGSVTGEKDAREYQRSFEKESGGEKVPIVSIQFPSRNKPFKVQPVDVPSESSNRVS